MNIEDPTRFSKVFTREAFRKRYGIAVFAVLFLALSLTAAAKCPASGCGSGSDSWETSAQDFLNSDVPLTGVSESQKTMTSSSFKAGESAISAANGTYQQTSSKSTIDLLIPDSRTDLFTNGDLLKPMPAISGSDLILDVSNQRAEGQARVRGAISLPLRNFLYENGTIKSASDIAQVLGSAGVSSNDPVVVYSDSFSSGDATLVVWILRYLGHDNVRAMDGDMNMWMDASLPLETNTNTRDSTNYDYRLRPELMADYKYVESGEPQLVDARTFQEYGESKIPSSTFIAPDQMIEEGRIKPGEKLNETFARLDQKRPVVIYSQDLFQASLVWYALQLMGFDSRIFNWQDWEERLTLQS
jgi:thiosulfate/3-mercaptopyruvate sulfurtransferase